MAAPGGRTMIEQTLDIATKDGAMETFICRPERGAHPAVLFLMDAPGSRDELRDMARRLATVGYYVPLPNLYYRDGRDTIYGPQVLEHGSPEHQRMRAVRTKMTIPPVMDDVATMLGRRSPGGREAWAGRRPRLLHERALRARCRRSPSQPRRRRGIFYGTWLVSDAMESPHLSLGKVKGELYIGCAEHDELAPCHGRGATRVVRAHRQPGRARALSRRPSRLRLSAA
jgi:carboxymethylenebutenolidase